MSPPDAALPPNPFFVTPQQRVALARRQYFEEGLRPSGIVSEAVIQSWSRCLRSGQEPQRAAVFEPVTPSRVHSVLRRNRELLQAASDELGQLQQILAGTSSTAMLTDAAGVIIGATNGPSRAHERVMPVATRIGVDLSEEAVGTTAPGITARTALPCVVNGGEHFFGNVQVMHCAAAPIRDVRGQLAGVLDLSSESVPFGFDAATVVGLHAVAIENRLLQAQSTDHLVVRLHVSPALLETPMAALAGIASSGRVDWVNGAAARLLALPPVLAEGRGPTAEAVFGVASDALASLVRREQPQALRLPSGLAVWIRGELRARDGHVRLHAAGGLPAHREQTSSPDSPATLRETDRQVIARTVAECGGNVSQAARRLGISRGRIYRHLRPETGA